MLIQRNPQSKHLCLLEPPDQFGFLDFLGSHKHPDYLEPVLYSVPLGNSACPEPIGSLELLGTLENLGSLKYMSAVLFAVVAPVDRTLGYFALDMGHMYVLADFV